MRIQRIIFTVASLFIALLAFAEAGLVTFMRGYLGFPDGRRSALERVQEFTYPCFIAVAMLFGAVALAAAWRYASGRYVGKKPALALFSTWVLLTAACVLVEKVCEWLRPPTYDIGMVVDGQIGEI